MNTNLLSMIIEIQINNKISEQASIWHILPSILPLPHPAGTWQTKEICFDYLEKSENWVIKLLPPPPLTEAANSSKEKTFLIHLAFSQD